MRSRIRDQAGLADDEAVDEASDQSFPASDPPAWIWRRRRKQAER